MLGEMWETKQFSKVLQNSLKVIYLQQTTKKLLHFQPFALSREEIQFFSWFSRVLEYLFCEISISKLSENGPKLYIIYRVWWKYWNWYLMELLTGGGGGGGGGIVSEITFWNIENLTADVTSSTQKRIKNV